jgi:hypothetical protein
MDVGFWTSANAFPLTLLVRRFAEFFCGMPAFDNTNVLAVLVHIVEELLVSNSDIRLVIKMLFHSLVKVRPTGLVI